jgi:hypothetical protein
VPCAFWLGKLDRLHAGLDALGGLGGLESVERHRSSAYWQLDLGGKGRSRSLNDENCACDDLEWMSDDGAR